MKIRITLKDPDGVENSVQEAVEESLAQIAELDLDEKEMIQEKRMDEAKGAIEKWVQYGEYVRIEIDTEEGTAKVLESP